MSELNVLSAIEDGDHGSQESAPVEPYRDPANDSAQDIVAGILKADEATPSVASGLAGNEPAEESFDPSEFELVFPDGTRRDVGEIIGTADALTARHSEVLAREHAREVAAARAVFDEEMTFQDPDTLGPAAMRLRQLDPGAFAEAISDHRQNELDDRTDQLDFTGDDATFAENYEELTAGPTTADQVAHVAETIQGEVERLSLEQEHARLSAELATKEQRAWRATMEAELGTTEPERIAVGYERLVGLQQNLAADPAFVDVLGGDMKLYAKLAVPLSEIPVDSPRYAETIRGLKAVYEGLDSAQERERLAKVFLSESTTISEALAPQEIATDWSINTSRVKAAMQTAPRTKRTAGQIRADVASAGVDIGSGLTRNGRPISIDEMDGSLERKDAEAKLERLRSRSALG